MHAFDAGASWTGHVALVYDDEIHRRLGVVAWLRRSLGSGAKVIYIEPPFEPPERSFLGLMSELGVDLGDAVGQGRLEVFTADEKAYDPAWQQSMVDLALAEGYPTVSWSGEAQTAWGVMPPAQHVDVEWATDDLCRAQPVSVLCQYPARLPQASLQTVCAEHGSGIREALLQTSPGPDGVALVGAVDASNERVLRSALAAAAATRGPGWLDVDLSRLEFLDVAGARALLTGTTSHRLRGGGVRLRVAEGTVERVLRLLGVDGEDHFTVEVTTG
jgi:anti-anti-sigma factor